MKAPDPDQLHVGAVLFLTRATLLVALLGCRTILTNVRCDALKKKEETRLKILLTKIPSATQQKVDNIR